MCIYVFKSDMKLYEGLYWGRRQRIEISKKWAYHTYPGHWHKSRQAWVFPHSECLVTIWRFWSSSSSSKSSSIPTKSVNFGLVIAFSMGGILGFFHLGFLLYLTPSIKIPKWYAWCDYLSFHKFTCFAIF